MKRIITIVLASLLLVLIIYHFEKVRNYRTQIEKDNAAIVNLQKENNDLQYDFGLTVAKTYCWDCHRFKYATDNLLEGVVQRVGEKYLTLFLTKQDSLITAKDSYATKLKATFGNLANSHNFKFSSAELKAIMEFMKR